MSFKRKAFIIFAAFAVVAVFAGAYRSFSAKDGREKIMQTEAVTRRDIASSVQATGVIRAKIGAEVKVGARISGRVEKLYANIGDVVNKSQVIARLEQEDL